MPCSLQHHRLSGREQRVLECGPDAFTRKRTGAPAFPHALMIGKAAQRYGQPCTPIRPKSRSQSGVGRAEFTLRDARSRDAMEVTAKRPASGAARPQMGPSMGQKCRKRRHRGRPPLRSRLLFRCVCWHGVGARRTAVVPGQQAWASCFIHCRAFAVWTAPDRELGLPQQGRCPTRV